MLYGSRYLDSTRFRMILNDMASRLEQERPLIFLNRCRTVDADDDEIIGLYTGKVYAADLISDGQEARVYTGGQFNLEVNAIPNLKVGEYVPQGKLNRMRRLARNQGTSGDAAILTDWRNQMAANLIFGVRQRANALCCAMFIGAMTYDRMGVKLSGNFGIPSAYRTQVATPWSSTSSTPISDILAARDDASDNDGEVYDRVTMSRLEFRNMANTTEFQNRIKGSLRVDLGSGAFDPRDRRLQGIASDILEMEIELYDGTLRIRNGERDSNKRVMPRYTVVLSSTNDDNTGQAYDLANAIPTETVVADMIGKGGENFGGEGFGPIGYFTGKSDMNPPNVTGWAVQRCMPRRFRKTCTRVLLVN